MHFSISFFQETVVIVDAAFPLLRYGQVTRQEHITNARFGRSVFVSR
jgi:hypothetical protein